MLERETHLERLLVHVEGETAAAAEVVRARGKDGVERMRQLLVVLDRLQPAGIGGLVDVFDDVHGPALLLLHQRGVSVADTIGVRPTLQAGEAVALLAPIATVVGQMHDAGVAHGSLGAARLTLCLDGLRIAGLENAVVFEPRAPEVVRESVPAVVLDREAVRALAADVLGRVAGPRRLAADQLALRLDEVPAPRVTLALLDGLADLAAAVPLTREVGSPTGEVVVRVDDLPAQPEEREGAVGRVLSGLLGGDISVSLTRVADRVRTAIGAVPHARKRLIVGGGSALAVAALLLALLPPPVPSDAKRAETSPAPTTAPGDDASRSPQPDGVASQQDDPVASVHLLLQTRERCFRELSVLCLDDVDQQGSEALRIDREAVLAMRDGAEGRAPVVASGEVQVIERLGDSVLLQIDADTGPASLLMMRSEAGWRIRDWVAVG